MGVNVPGGSNKFTVLDTLGHRVAQQGKAGSLYLITVPQLPQSSYHALGTPYSYIGLGRTNNYVEVGLEYHSEAQQLFVGASLYPPYHTTYLESLIPNSQVLINPPHPDTFLNLTLHKRDLTRPIEWKSQLYLKPGDWVPIVAAAVFGTVIILGFVVFGLGQREKREDEKERRQALHAINFQAL
jgi:integrin alpha FG-GAP repeat containing protein 1